jgi:hypothetical protein
VEALPKQWKKNTTSVVIWILWVSLIKPGQDNLMDYRQVYGWFSSGLRALQTRAGLHNVCPNLHRCVVLTCWRVMVLVCWYDGFWVAMCVLTSKVLMCCLLCSGRYWEVEVLWCFEKEIAPEVNSKHGNLVVVSKAKEIWSSGTANTSKAYIFMIRNNKNIFKVRGKFTTILVVWIHKVVVEGSYNRHWAFFCLSNLSKFLIKQISHLKQINLG